MSDSEYALVVSMLTAGGLVGALASPRFNDQYGRRLTLLGTNIFLGLGSLLTTLSSTSSMMMVGRFVAGLGVGAVTVVVPAYLAECAPRSKRGLFGTFNQIAIVLGIFTSQIFGLVWSNADDWRWILGVGVFLSILQSCLLPLCVDSPQYLAFLPGGLSKAKYSLKRLRGEAAEKIEEEIKSWKRDGDVPTKITTWTFLISPYYRRPLTIVLLLQITQQLSGVNAVVFFSTSILSDVFPDSAGYITVFISVVNLAVSFFSAALMDKAGRRSLFLISSCLMALMGVLLGWSIGAGYNLTSAWASFGFIGAFAIGLGPIPFLMIPEVVEMQAVSSACSIGLAVNMVTNFVVSSAFLPLRSFLGPHVFYLFSISLIALSVAAYYILPETKGKSVEEVIKSGYSANSSYELVSTSSI
ncbi:general substrate transporter [Sporodiniella umbellata]|nr:general substrate transporter [Sporodiniella umbellata]